MCSAPGVALADRASKCNIFRRLWLSMHRSHNCLQAAAQTIARSRRHLPRTRMCLIAGDPQAPPQRPNAKGLPFQ